MTALREYLLAGRTPEDLRRELGVVSYRHPTLPLVGFSYSQSDSPKFHPVVRDARGIVLEDRTWHPVARPFRRFYNAGECPEDDAAFRWDACVAEEKDDGSLMIVYRYGGDWHVNTSGSFGLGPVAHGVPGSSYAGTWRELFWSSVPFGPDDPGLHPAYTYLFELCTPHNPVVRPYDRPRVTLLAAIRTADGVEAGPYHRDQIAAWLGVSAPRRFAVSRRDEADALVADEAARVRLFEGLVVRDLDGRRLKVKSAAYVAMHRLWACGLTFERAVAVVLMGEVDEVALALPAYAERLRRVRDELDAGLDALWAVWESTRGLDSQKEFAAAVLGATPLAHLLFRLRRECGASASPEQLRALWRASGSLILKALGGRLEAAAGAVAVAEGA